MPITISEARPDSPDAFALLRELDDVLLALPYPQESRHAFSVEKLIQQHVVFFVVSVDGQPAGCGGVKLFGTEYAEAKRMFVRPAFRGRGFAKAILDRLAEYSRGRGVGLLRLETSIYQTAAIGLYERGGFRRRGPFGEYREDPLSVYFEKVIECKLSANVIRVLFVCVENANRSQMAEAFARILGGDAVEAYSAGSRPSGVVNPKAVAAMAELGYDLSMHGSKSLDDLPDVEFDFVATMGCGDACPLVKAKKRDDWQIPDPKHMPPREFNVVRDLIRSKVKAALGQVFPQ